VVGLLTIAALSVHLVKAAILLGIVASTVPAVIVEAIGRIGPRTVDGMHPTGWALDVPKLPERVVDVPDLGLLGHFSLFGSFPKIGAVTAGRPAEGRPAEGRVPVGFRSTPPGTLGADPLRLSPSRPHTTARRQVAG
jgi:hypothetical protein